MPTLERTISLLKLKLFVSLAKFNQVGAPERQVVVVLGMHRSGTSAVGAVLEALGVHMGDRMLPANEFNPIGYFEDEAFLILNEKLLRDAGGDWLHIPPAEQIKMALPKFKHKAQELVAANTKYPVWGWKDPRTSLTIELFLPLLTNPRFVVCHRDKAEVAASLQKRDQLPLTHATHLKDTYDEAITGFFRAHPSLKRIDIQYSQLQAHPLRTVARLTRFLRLSPTLEQSETALSRVVGKEQLKKMSRRLAKRP